jgi:hypothetical protein
MLNLNQKRRIFILALRLYLLHLSGPPHISTSILTRAIIELVDNFVIMQNKKEPELLEPGPRFLYAIMLSKFAHEVSRRMEEQNFI